MKKIIILSFLIAYGFVIALIKQNTVLKFQIEGVDYSFIKGISWFDFGVGFFHPFLVFIFYMVTYKMTLLLFSEDEKEPKFLSTLIVLSLIPSFIYSIINLYFLNQINNEEFMEINRTGIGYIIPNISLENSKFIANSLLILPSIIFFFFLIIKKNMSLFNSILTSHLPIILITILFYII